MEAHIKCGVLLAHVRVHEGILGWYDREKRDLPWRKTTDPYKILVSEIMLQQTQVDRVIPKYHAWLASFPTWQALAEASRTTVLQHWSGLGYNNRAVRLHTLAQVIVAEFHNELPRTEEELVKLPGIGPYTAGAIRVFAHNQPGNCLDVNLERFLKRFFYGKEERPSLQEVRAMLLKTFPERARDWGNALMDFGSGICTSQRPKCEECPVFAECRSKGERPEEQQIRKKKRQSTFLHSNRWWRGQILRRLTETQEKKEELLSAILERATAAQKKQFHAALQQLQEEGLVVGSQKLSINES